MGSEKVSTNPTGSTITISSTGSSFSSSPGDITITAQVNYVTSDPLHITTHKPAYAVQPNSVTNCDSNYGYETDITYIVEDQLLNPMTAGITWNEKWSTPETPVYPNENWGRPLEIGGRNSGQYLMDIITGPFVNNSPANIPQPTCGGAASEVQYWDQQFYVGTLTSGDGVLINSHTFARYTQHAEHQ